MALLLLNFASPSHLSSSSSSSRCSLSSSSTTVAVNAFPSLAVSRLHIKPVDLYSYSLGGICCSDKLFSFSRRVRIVAKASLDIEETGPDGEKPVVSESDDDDDDDDEENIPSKLQLKLEQKMRMKVAKRVRIRRKKLIRKRRMRKKGRWPPSKMKKLKNV